MPSTDSGDLYCRLERQRSLASQGKPIPLRTGKDTGKSPARFATYKCSHFFGWLRIRYYITHAALDVQRATYPTARTCSGIALRCRLASLVQGAGHRPGFAEREDFFDAPHSVFGQRPYMSSELLAFERAPVLGLPPRPPPRVDWDASAELTAVVLVSSHHERRPRAALCADGCYARALTLALRTCMPLALRLGASSDVLDERTRIPAAEPRTERCGTGYLGRGDTCRRPLSGFTSGPNRRTDT